ncbi:MAG: hypothetical protein KF889_02050 [Alphaproteobacteria bacterium]|nr:hypothetical protein [Alphaproteobacteria bacterium]MCW5741691.1 hypothetical protein [Alphaproteobacteria bacterium]
MSGPWSVVRVDMAHYQTPESEREVGRYGSPWTAREAAREILRRSLIDLRGQCQSDADLSRLWWIYGEDAFVHGPDGTSWRASNELDSIIAALPKRW